jgi:replicative DNA helicase
LANTDLYNNEAEQFLLAALVSNPREYWTINDVGLTEQDFVNTENRKIARAILDAVTEKNEPSLPYIVEHLKRNGAVESVEYLSSLTTIPCSPSQAHDYARIVRSLSVNRRVGMMGAKIITLSQEKRTDFESVISDAEGMLRKLTRQLPDQEHSPKAEDIIRKLTESTIGDRIPITFSPTLQSMTGGFARGHFWVIGGFSSVGKSAFACNVVLDALRHKGRRIAIISCEMTQQQYMIRLLSILSNVPQRDIQNNVTIGIEAQKGLEFAKKRLSESELYIYDTVSTMAGIRTELMRLKNQDGVDMFILDYIQNVHVTGDEFSDARTVAIECQNLAKELDCTVIAFSQLSNAQAKYEMEGGNENYYSLKGHGAIRDAADVILTLHRDRKDVTKERILEVKFRKNRHGPTSDFECAFDLGTGRIEEAEFEWEDQK